MSPVLQVIFGELIGTIIIFVAVFLSRRRESEAIGISIILGTTILSMLIAWFLIGETNLYFSTIAMKNIFITIMYEEVIWICSAFVASMITPNGSIEVDDRNFIWTCIIIAVVVSTIFGTQSFIPAIIKSIG